MSAKKTYSNWLKFNRAKKYGNGGPVGNFQPLDIFDSYGYGRKSLGNSTESTMGIETDEGYFNIPTVIDGKRYSPEEAVQLFYKTGNHMGQYSSQAEADAGAESREKANIGWGSTGLKKYGEGGPVKPDEKNTKPSLAFVKKFQEQQAAAEDYTSKSTGTTPKQRSDKAGINPNTGKPYATGEVEYAPIDPITDIILPLSALKTGQAINKTTALLKRAKSIEKQAIAREGREGYKAIGKQYMTESGDLQPEFINRLKFNKIDFDLSKNKNFGPAYQIEKHGLENKDGSPFFQYEFPKKSKTQELLVKHRAGKIGRGEVRGAVTQNKDLIENAQGIYHYTPTKKGQVFLNASKNKIQNPKSTAIHEFTHYIDDGGNLFNANEARDLRRAFYPREAFTNKSKKFSKTYDYFTTPTEVRARMNEIRHVLNPENPWKRVHDPKDIFDNSEIAKNSNVKYMLDMIEDKEGFTNTYNRMWGAVPAVGIGASYLNNSNNDMTTKKFEQGGIIPEGFSEINIEKGELYIEPEAVADGTFKIGRTYSGQRPHAKGTKKEPLENFQYAKAGGMIIPTKWAKKFEAGDKLRKQSMVMNLQRNAPVQYAKTGGIVSSPDLGIPDTLSVPADRQNTQMATGLNGTKPSGMNYAGMGTSALSGVMGFTQPGATEQQKADALYNSSLGVVGSAGPYGAAIAGVTSAADSIAAPIKSWAERTDENGLENRGQAQTMYGIGASLNPFKAGVSELSKDDPNWVDVGLGFSGLGILKSGKYADDLEKPFKDAQKAKQAQLNQINTMRVGQEMASNQIENTDTMNPYKMKYGGRVPMYGRGTSNIDGLPLLDYSRQNTLLPYTGRDPLDYSGSPQSRLPQTWDFVHGDNFYRSGVLPNVNLDYSSGAKFSQPQGGLNINNPAFNQSTPANQSSLDGYKTGRVMQPSGSGDDSASMPRQAPWASRNQDALMATGGGLLNSVGDIYDIVRGSKSEKVDYGSVTPQYMSADEQIADARLNYSTTRDAIRRTGGSGRSILGGYLANKLGTDRTMSGIRERVGNINTGIANDSAWRNKENQIRGRDATDANYARSRDLMRSGLGGLGKNAAYAINDYQTGGTNQKVLDTLALRYGGLPAYEAMLKQWDNRRVNNG